VEPERGRLLALELVLLGGLLAAALYQRAHTGLQLELLVLAALHAPGHLRRAWAWRSRLTPPPLILVGVELGSLLGVGAAHVEGWAVWLAAAGCLLSGWGSRRQVSDGAEAGAEAGALAWLVWPALVGAVACQVLAAQVPTPLRWLRGALFVPVVWEALARGGERADAASLRRVAVCLAVGAVTWARGEPWLLLGAVSLGAGLTSLVAGSLARAEPAARARLARRWVLRLAVPSLLLTVSWGVGELAFRVVPNDYRERVAPDPEGSGDLHVPGGTYEFKGMLLGQARAEVNLVRWNAHGWHDVDHALEKPAGTVRLLVMGDSFVEGLQVQTDELFHRVLEEQLRTDDAATSVEAIAYGWSGWGQGEALEALLEGRAARPAYPPGLAYDPDLVLLEFLPSNDVRDNSPALEAASAEETSRATLARPLYLESLRRGLYFSACVFDNTDLLLRQLSGRRDPLDAGVFQPQPAREAALWAEAWERTEDLLRRFKAELDQRGVGLVVVVFTGQAEVEACVDPANQPEGLDLRYPARRVVALCEQLGVPCLDLQERFAQRPAEERSGLHLAHDGHWTPAGHRLAGQETAAFLRREGLLTR
jgi:SGNH hydrolase-like domain, acetyltransferase AlgX